MTETEPEFDALERDSWYALKEYEDEVCPKCGNLRAICSDPEQAFYPQRSTCWATAAHEVALRKWAKVTDADNAKPDRSGYMSGQTASGEKVITDGVTVWMATEDLTPDDDFL